MSVFPNLAVELPQILPWYPKKLQKENTLALNLVFILNLKLYVYF